MALTKEEVMFPDNIKIQRVSATSQPWGPIHEGSDAWKMILSNPHASQAVAVSLPQSEEHFKKTQE